MANNMVPNHSLSPADKQCLSFACRVYLCVCVWKLRLEADELLITGLKVPFFFFLNVFLQSPCRHLRSWLLIAVQSCTGLQDWVKTVDLQTEGPRRQWEDWLIAFDSSLSFFHSKRWEFNYFTFFYYSSNTQPLQYNDNKSLYKLPDVLLSGRMSITECCVSIFKTTHKTNKQTKFLW